VQRSAGAEYRISYIDNNKQHVMYLGWGMGMGKRQAPLTFHFSCILALENLAVLLKRDRLSENLCILEACCD